MSSVSVARLAARMWSASALTRYGVAIALAAVSIGVRLALTPLWGADVRLIMFVPAVLLSAWFGGAAPAIVATLTCTLATDYVWLPPVHSLRIADPEDALDLFVFVLVGALCGAVIEALHQTRRTVERHSAHLAELLDERARLIDAEREARAVAETANRAKDEFFATVAHELRNPLAAITAAAHVLDRSGVASDTVRPREVIVRQAAHLGRMVDDLVDVGRVLSGKIRLRRERIDLRTTVRWCIRSLEETGRLAGHSVTTELQSVWVDVDPLRAEQVVMNLLVNAVKYTPAGGNIEVMLHSREKEAVLEVRDTGIGIPNDLLPRVFDLFVQGERGAEHSDGGLGIGLALVRRLVELHGGAVKAASDGPGRGSTFSVRLPRSAAARRDRHFALRTNQP